jgi:hypothetical protein
MRHQMGRRAVKEREEGARLADVYQPSPSTLESEAALGAMRKKEKRRTRMRTWTRRRRRDVFLLGLELALARHTGGPMALED